MERAFKHCHMIKPPQVFFRFIFYFLFEVFQEALAELIRIGPLGA
jgi:hypothetical protein